VYSTRAGRATSAKRLSPQKAGLHLTPAAQGASIGGGSKGERTYVKITAPYIAGMIT